MIEREQWLQQLPALRAKIAATITTKLFPQNVVNAFKQSQLADGTYEIDGGDLPLISSAKAIINMLYRMEILIGTLLDPTLSYYRAESLLQKATAGIVLAAKGGLVINDILAVKADIHHLNYYLNALNNTLKDLPHVNAEFDSFITNLKATLNNNLVPAFAFFQNMQPEIKENPIENTHESEFILQKIFNKNLKLLSDLKSQTLTARQMLDNYIQKKLAISPSPNTHFYPTNDVSNNKEHAVLRAANALTHFYNALDKTSQLLKFQEFHLFEMIEELSLALNNLNYALDSTKDFSAEELKNILGHLFEKIQPVLLTLTTQIETIELNLGLKNGVLQNKFSSLLQQYQNAAAKFGISVDGDNYKKEILLTRKEAAIRADREYKALSEIKLTVEFAHPNEKSSLYELMQLLAEVKKIKTAAGASYSDGLKKIIEARTGLDALNIMILNKERALSETTLPDPIIDELKILYLLRHKAESQLKNINDTKNNAASFYVDIANRTIIMDASLKGNEINLLNSSTRNKMQRSLEQLHLAKHHERTRVAALVVESENQLLEKVAMNASEANLRSDLMKLNLITINQMTIAKIYQLICQLERYDNKETYLLREILNKAIEDKSGLSALNRELTSLQSAAQTDKDIDYLNASIHDLSSALKQKRPVVTAQVEALAQIMGTSIANVSYWIEESKQQSSYSFYDYIIIAKIKDHIDLLKNTEQAPSFPNNSEERRNKLTLQIKALQEKVNDGTAMDRDVYTEEGGEHWEIAKYKALQAIHATLLTDHRPLKTSKLIEPPPDFSTTYNPDATPGDIYTAVVEKVKGPLIIHSEKLRQQIIEQAEKILGKNFQSTWDNKTIHPGDSLLIKNLKSISNTLKSFENIVAYSQKYYEHFLQDGMIDKYVSLLTTGIPGLEAHSKDLEIKLNDMIFYITEWKQHIPDMPVGEQIQAYKALQAWAQPTLTALKTWAANTQLISKELSVKIDDAINALTAEAPIGPEQQYTTVLYNKVIDALDQYLSSPAKTISDDNLKHLIKFRDAFKTLGQTFFEMKKIATSDDIKNYIRFLLNISDLYNQFLTIDIPQLKQLQTDIKKFLEESHKMLCEIPGNLIVLEQHTGLSSSNIAETINFKSTMIEFEKLGEKLGMETKDKYPYFKTTLNVLDREQTRVEYQYQRLQDLAAKFPDFDIATAPAEQLVALNLLAPSERNIKSALDLQPHIDAYRNQLNVINRKMVTLNQQYQNDVDLQLEKLRTHLKSIEVALALPTNSLSRLTYIESATTHLQAKRVDDLSSPQGLLKFLMPKVGSASEAYKKILDKPLDSKMMHQAIYDETQKHSWGFGRLMRRWFSKPSMADQLYTLAKHLANPDNSQRYKKYIQDEIKYMETISLDILTTGDLKKSLRAGQFKERSRFSFVGGSIQAQKKDRAQAPGQKETPRNRKVP